MSVEAMALVLNHSQATGTTKLVLVGIANHDGDGGAWPAIETLARYAGKSETTVHRAIRELTDLGEIEVERNAGGTRDTPADRRPNLYRILVRCPPECDGTKNHRMARGAASDTPRGAARASDGVPPVAPEPSLEPSQEPSTEPKGSAPSSPRKSRARTTPEADEITRGWWEEQEPRPMQQFVAVRQIVQKALTAGYTREEIIEALRRIRGAPPVTSWKLEKAVAAAHQRHDARAEAEEPDDVRADMWWYRLTKEQGGVG